MFEEWNVLTYKDYDFEDNGRKITGRTLHCWRMTKDPDWHGVEYAKLSISSGSEAYATPIVPGAAYRFVFDRRGKVAQLEKVEQANG